MRGQTSAQLLEEMRQTAKEERENVAKLPRGKPEQTYPALIAESAASASYLGAWLMRETMKKEMERRGMNTRRQRCEALLEALKETNKELNEQSEEDAERRYREVVQSILTLIAPLTLSDHTVICVLLGVALGRLIGLLL